jgi:predicted nucleic acid-binding protein
MTELIADREKLGFMTIKAKVAADLSVAQNFYERNGFEIVRSIPGGQARKRTIVIRVRELETDHLFAIQPAITEVADFDLGARRRGASDSPFYTFDLNVFFDLVRSRSRHDDAGRLFSAALAHQIRLVVAPEFLVELDRNSSGRADDPILQMARRLPRLPAANPAELNKLADQIHRMVFVEPDLREKDTVQSRSDARHLAHSALSRAAGFITSDAAILNSRDKLLSRIGLDVASLEELVSLLQIDLTDKSQNLLQGTNFECRVPTSAELQSYLSAVGLSSGLISEFSDEAIHEQRHRWEAIFEGNRIVGATSIMISSGIEKVARLLVHVTSEHLSQDFFADYLLDSSIRFACADSPISIQMVRLAGQSTVQSLARSRGFLRVGHEEDFEKVAIGRPLTKRQWPKIVNEIRRRTGLTIPSNVSDMSGRSRHLTITNRAGKNATVSLESLEDMLSPTLVTWPERDGVLVPITRGYANDLFGTSDQMALSFMKSRDAVFLSRRAYVNSPKAANIMRPGKPILFYESVRSKGRGAVIAVARIVDAVVTRKSEITEDGQKRIVVDDVDRLSASDEVLLTTFDNILLLRSPVPLKILRELDAVGKANLVTAQVLSSDHIEKILDLGWPND